MNESFYNSGINVWLSTLVWMVFKVFLPGLAWSWAIPVDKLPLRDDRLTLWAFKAACSVLLGLLTHLLLALMLAELGVYTGLVELICTILLIAAGVSTSALMQAGSLRRHLLDNVPGLLLFNMGIIIIMMLPKSSEWLLGGLDPGVYLNQGVYVERTATFHPDPDPFFSELDDGELSQFTRGDGEYRECMPGIPLDTKTRAIQNYFFRLTPTMIASMTRSGGLRAAVRSNYFAGLMAVMIFWGMLAANGAGRPHQFFALALLAVHPIFLYQLNIPTSEVLQLCLVLGIGLLLPLRKHGWFAPAMLGLAFLAAVVNRLSFMPFAGILVFGIAWLDKERYDRKRVWMEHGMILAGLLAGICFDWLVCSITLERLRDPMPVMITVTAITILLAIALDVFGGWGTTRSMLGDLPEWLYRLACIGVIVFVAVLWDGGKKMGLKESYETFHSMAPYLNKAFIVTALVGAIMLFWKARPGLSVLKLLVSFMCAVTLIVLIKSFVEGNYPWSVRRFLAYTVPLLAILIGHLLSLVWNSRFLSAGLMKAIAVVLCAVLLATTAKKSWHAWNRVEYRGVSDLLADIASRIDDNDIVIIDTPTWGTPLRFVYGRNIVNGKHLWRRKSAERMLVALRALERMRTNGARIRFLTTTRETAMDIYPVKLAGINLDFETGETAFEEINHSRRADDFEVRIKQNVFRLFTWTGSANQP